MFPKPIIIASKCLGFAACRYNGQSLPDPVVEGLKKYVEFQTVCPEVEIGLGVPREPIRIISEEGKLKLFQPATGLEITSKMTGFADLFLGQIKDVDGFILKFKSPSCGLKGVKVYPGREKSGSISTTSGFFGAEVLKRFAFYPVEDEGRLKNFGIRENFLTKLFIFAKFRNLKKTACMDKLVRFHTQNKLLLMAYDQKELKNLGQIVANHEQKLVVEVVDLYEAHFFNAFLKQPRISTCSNVLLHAFGYFSKNIKSSEKKYFLETLEKYRAKKVPLSVPTAVIKSLIARFEEKYLSAQTFFNPYPEELLEVTDSGKGRDWG
ncbi:MAG: DUF523 and DUF1722 domain-containing protein [Pseudomonadota bacterium]